jgi:hypothetical protein
MKFRSSKSKAEDNLQALIAALSAVDDALLTRIAALQVKLTTHPLSASLEKELAKLRDRRHVQEGRLELASKELEARHRNNKRLQDRGYVDELFIAVQPWQNEVNNIETQLRQIDTEIRATEARLEAAERHEREVAAGRAFRYDTSANSVRSQLERLHASANTIRAKLVDEERVVAESERAFLAMAGQGQAVSGKNLADARERAAIRRQDLADVSSAIDHASRRLAEVTAFEQDARREFTALLREAAGRLYPILMAIQPADANFRRLIALGNDAAFLRDEAMAASDALIRDLVPIGGYPSRVDLGVALVDELDSAELAEA